MGRVVVVVVCKPLPDTEYLMSDEQALNMRALVHAAEEDGDTQRGEGACEVEEARARGGGVEAGDVGEVKEDVAGDTSALTLPRARRDPPASRGDERHTRK